MKTKIFISIITMALLVGCGKPQVYVEPHSIGVVQVTTRMNSFTEPLTDADLEPYREQGREMCEDWGFSRNYKTTGVSRKTFLNQYCTVWDETLRAACVKE